MSAPPLMVVENLELSFRGVVALSGLSFDVMRAELLAVIGPNGAGKTSLFNCLSGIYRPQRGSIRLEGRELVGRRPTSIAQLGVGRTFQNLGLFSNLDVIENLMLGRHNQMRAGFFSTAVGVGPGRREEAVHREAVEEIVELLELEAYRRQAVGTLPYGVQKRIEFGRALAMNPKLLLLDEPVAGMNMEETEDIVRFIHHVKSTRELAIILIEHDMAMVMDIADRVLALNFGTPLALGAPEEVQSDPQVVTAYLGAPR